jgi:DNA polymerase III epsilon subunit family exonuclease
LPREFVVFDTETSGMPPGGRLVEIGAIRVRGGHVVDRFQRLVFPEGPIPEQVIAIHGIDDAMVADAPSAKEVLPEFLAWADRAPLFGHNIAFDARVLACEAQRYGVELPSNRLLCTLRAARRLLKRPSHALESLVDDLGLPRGAHHRAMEDAEHTLHLYWKMQELLGEGCTASAFATGRTLDSYAEEQPRLPASRSVLREAADHGDAVELRYRARSGSLFQALVTPRLFYRRGKSTFMEALCHHSGWYKSYSIDRVVAAQLRPEAAPAELRRPTRP